MSSTGASLSLLNWESLTKSPISTGLSVPIATFTRFQLQSSTGVILNWSRQTLKVYRPGFLDSTSWFRTEVSPRRCRLYL